MTNTDTFIADIPHLGPVEVPGWATHYAVDAVGACCVYNEEPRDSSYRWIGTPWRTSVGASWSARVGQIPHEVMRRPENNWRCMMGRIERPIRKGFYRDESGDLCWVGATDAPGSHEIVGKIRRAGGPWYAWSFPPKAVREWEYLGPTMPEDE